MDKTNQIILYDGIAELISMDYRPIQPIKETSQESYRRSLTRDLEVAFGRYVIENLKTIKTLDEIGNFKTKGGVKSVAEKFNYLVPKFESGNFSISFEEYHRLGRPEFLPVKILCEYGLPERE